MDYGLILKKRNLFLLPAIAAFILALIPTLEYQWPLGWDIIYHVQYAQVYAHDGFTLINPLLNAPTGQKIGYPPLFHFLIVGIGALGIDYFQVARLLQPILAMSVVLSVSYIARKFYGDIAGLGAGFLMLSSLLMGRMILPLPENLALIFLPLAVYLYYQSLQTKNLKPAFLGGILLIVIILTHQGATLCLILSIIGITIMELVLYRNIKVLSNFISFFLMLLIIALAGVIALQIFAPQLLQTLLGQGITALTGMSTSLISSRPMSAWSYLGNLGILVLIFSIIGAVFAVKRHQRKDNVLLVWIIAMILLSNAYWFGVNVISYRVLIYLLIPLCILGGYGIHCACHKLKEHPRFSSKKVRTTFLVIVCVFSLIIGVLTVTDPDISIFNAKNEFGNVQIAPPSNSEVELANWFQENGNTSRSLVTNNQFTGMFLASKAGMPMNYGFEYYSLKDIPYLNISKVKDQGIGYIVYDKNLVLPKEENKMYIVSIASEFFPLYYFSQNITKNFDDKIKPDFTTKVYENKDFIVCKVDY
jgi:4-amino-4-deoxy-L-arabinose transferase-like glycosyltransferase